MLHKRKCKIILVCLLIFVAIFYITPNVNAAINEDYYEINKGAMEVVDSALDDKTSGSTLLSAVGLLIYSVGSLLEWIMGAMYRLMTNTSIFPWADAIVFNAIPLLDINFLNPTQVDGGGLVFILRDQLANLYSTVFGLAVTFFAVAVMVMAIKLVITTIASEKAKYKQALVQWGVGLLLLFTIHYAMSFIFYLNEQLVNLASEIATANIVEANANIEALTNSDEYNNTLIYNFVTCMNSGGIHWMSVIVKALLAIVIVIAVVVITVGTAGIGTLIAAGAAGIAAAIGLAYIQYNEMAWAIEAAIDSAYISIVDGIDSSDEASKYLYDNSDLAAALLKSSVYQSHEKRLNGARPDTETWESWSVRADVVYIKRVASDIRMLTENPEVPLEGSDGKTKNIKYREALELIVKVVENTPVNQRGEDYDPEKIALYKTLLAAYDEAYGKDASEVSLLTNLATYFKKTAWTTSATGWKANKSVIQNALMYAILVVQSLILFIAYMKRLFYVIILAMMAPIVVVYDFFNKSLS